MKRREFITLIGAAAMWPAAARGQQPGTTVVGYLSSTRSDATAQLMDKFREGLSATGFVEAKNLSVEYRWAELHQERLPALALDLVQRRVNAIFASGEAALNAVRSATQTISIVAADLNSDPVEAGIAASLARPGGNVTGVFLAFADVAAKWLELLKEAIPKLSRVQSFGTHLQGCSKSNPSNAQPVRSMYRWRYWKCDPHPISTTPFTRLVNEAQMPCSC